MISKIKIPVRIFLLAMLPVLVSCVSRPVSFNREVIEKDTVRIAVLPFRDYNKVEGNNSGDLVRNVFETKLVNKGFKVISIEQSASAVDYSVMKEYDFNSSWIIKTGEVIGADYMLFGSIHDYKVFQFSSTFIYIFEWLETTYSVGVTARLVSCKTGEVVWTGSMTRKSFTPNDAAEEVVIELIKSIKYKSTVSDKQ